MKLFGNFREVFGGAGFGVSYPIILPYALTDIPGRLAWSVAQRLLVQNSKKGRIIVQRFKSIKVKDKNR